MSILINKFRIGTIKGRGLAGGSIGIASYNKDNWNRNKITTFQKFVSIPVGTRPPHCFLLAQETGGLASHGSSNVLLQEFNINLAGGLYGDSNISGTIQTLNIIGELVLQGLASLSASGYFISPPTLNGASYAQAILAANLLSLGDLGAIIDMVMSENILITQNINLQAAGSMVSVIGGPNPLSPEGLAEAVWSKNLSSYMTDETAGKLIKEIKEEVKKKLDAGLFIALK